jgi:hypothetical protein
MRLQKHIRLLVIVTIAWILFLIAGLPDYYQQYSIRTMLIFDLVILFPIWWILYRSIKRSKPGRGVTVALWWSFYFSAPLCIYDFLYCGVWLGHGIRFLWMYWYLTAYYIIPWLILPITGWLVDRKRMQN